MPLLLERLRTEKNKKEWRLLKKNAFDAYSQLKKKTKKNNARKTSFQVSQRFCLFAGASKTTCVFWTVQRFKTAIRFFAAYRCSPKRPPWKHWKPLKNIKELMKMARIRQHLPQKNKKEWQQLKKWYIKNKKEWRIFKKWDDGVNVYAGKKQIRMTPIKISVEKKQKRITNIKKLNASQTPNNSSFFCSFQTSFKQSPIFCCLAILIA